MEKTFVIVSTEDVREDLESFTLELSGPVFGVIGSPSVATVFIIDESGTLIIPNTFLLKVFNKCQ